MSPEKLSEATVGGGCFWCTEAVLQRLRGVKSVYPGYAGGRVPGTPTYREVCSGLTGHAEVVRVMFDPDTLSYRDLLTVFMATHDHRAKFHGGKGGGDYILPPGGDFLEGGVRKDGARREDFLPVERVDRKVQRQGRHGIPLQPIRPRENGAPFLNLPQSFRFRKWLFRGRKKRGGP